MKETMTPYIELKNIDRIFGVTKALDQMSLKLFPGQVIGLIGSNGAGKSTLFKVLTDNIRYLENRDGEKELQKKQKKNWKNIFLQMELMYIRQWISCRLRNNRW